MSAINTYHKYLKINIEIKKFPIATERAKKEAVPIDNQEDCINATCDIFNENFCKNIFKRKTKRHRFN